MLMVIRHQSAGRGDNDLNSKRHGSEGEAAGFTIDGGFTGISGGPRMNAKNRDDACALARSAAMHRRPAPRPDRADAGGVSPFRENWRGRKGCRREYGGRTDSPSRHRV
jgi:hypothetical protein